MPFVVKILGQCENSMKHMNTVCGQNAGFRNDITRRICMYICIYIYRLVAIRI